jgi:phosphate starvation-inducible protein PhoH and related proteins
LSQIIASSATQPVPPPRSLTLTFADNALLPLLLGDHDRHLARIEQRLGVRLACRGNRVSISGSAQQVAAAEAALAALYRRLEKGEMIDGPMVDAAMRLTDPTSEPRLPLSDLPAIRTRKGAIGPRSAAQTAYIDLLARHEMVFALGPAGTGKTYLAVAQAVAMLTSGRVDRIVLSRPAVEAGESIGFLPGEMEDKLAPYLRPLYDALSDRLSMKRVRALMAEGAIEIAPIGFMRGRTLNNAFVVIDEAQNCTYAQMKMLLTRLGWHSTMVITGDPEQTDLLPELSGLAEVARRLDGIGNISVVRLADVDIVRHPLVGEMLAVL